MIYELSFSLIFAVCAATREATIDCHETRIRNKRDTFINFALRYETVVMGGVNVDVHGALNTMTGGRWMSV